MKRLTDKEYQYELRRIQKDNLYREKNLRLKEERKKFLPKKKLPSTSKLIAAYLFLILNVVLVYAMITMYQFRDLTYLGVLITDIAAQILTYFIYARKAIIENTKSGITYELAMMEKRNELQTQDECFEDEDVSG